MQPMAVAMQAAVKQREPELVARTAAVLIVVASPTSWTITFPNVLPGVAMQALNGSSVAFRGN